MAYAFHAQQSEQASWPLIQFNAGQFHMLVDPGKVAGSLVLLAGRLIR